MNDKSFKHEGVELLRFGADGSLHVRDDQGRMVDVTYVLDLIGFKPTVVKLLAILARVKL